MKVTKVIHKALEGNIREAIKEICTKHHGNGCNASALIAKDFQEELVSRIMGVKTTFETDRALRMEEIGYKEAAKMSKKISKAILRKLREEGNLELLKEILGHIGGRSRGEGRSFMNIQSLIPDLALADKRFRFLIENGFLADPSNNSDLVRRGYAYELLPDTVLRDLDDAREIARKVILKELELRTQLNNATICSVANSIIRDMQGRSLFVPFRRGSHIQT